MKRRIPTGGSANCTRVVWPNHETRPSLPFEKSPPSGITDQTRNAGTNARYGASLNTKRSARSGMRSSLKNNLMPSASVCRSPHGPALLGPMRFCRPAMALRSNHTMNIVTMRPMAKIATTFRMMIRSGVQRRSPSATGSIERRAVFIRCSPLGRRSPEPPNR